MECGDYKRGALKQLEEVLQDYKLDLIAVQEIRWIGQIFFGEEELQYYCSQKSKYDFGCRFVVNSITEDSVTDFKPINH